MKTEYNTIIIGAGVAGISAAIYLKRANIDFLILEGEIPGGQINRTADIENYPGIISIKGPDLAMQMYNQLQALEIKLSTEVVEKVSSKNKIFEIKTTKNTYQSHNVIIATGRRPKKLEIPGEDKYINYGISFCAVCDGFFFRNKEVAVIGGGRAALEEALYLSNLCSKVTLIHRRDEFRAEDSLVKNVKLIGNIEVVVNASVKEFIGDNNQLNGIRIEVNKAEKIIPVSGCFTYIGQLPNTEIFEDLDILDQNHYIITDKDSKTKIEGIYAAGDCCSKNVYQIITAESEGIIAANMVISKENINNIK